MTVVKACTLYVTRLQWATVTQNRSASNVEESFSADNYYAMNIEVSE